MQCCRSHSWEEVVICGLFSVQETVEVVILCVTTQVFPLPKMSELKNRKINREKCIKIHTPWHCNSTLSGINHAWMNVCLLCDKDFVCPGSVKAVWRRTYRHLSLPLSVSLSLSVRVVRLDWSRPDRPSGIMLGYEVLRRTLRSCAVGSTGVASSVGEESGGAGGVRFRCSYLQCPASHGVCGTSCFPPDIQVIMFWTFGASFN